MCRFHSLILLPVAAICAALLAPPALAQKRSELGPLCTTETTPADQQIAACDKILQLKVFKGAQLATIYFWRAVGWNKKGDYARVIEDTTEALRLNPGQIALLNMRGSAWFDKGEYDIAIADFTDALKIGPPSGTIYHNRGNAYRRNGDYAHALADYDQAVRLSPNEAHSWTNRGAVKQALGDLDGALADLNQAIRLAPTLPAPRTSRAVLWRAKNEIDRAIADTSEAIALGRTRAPVNVMTPPGSVLISAYLQRGLAYEAKGEIARARADFEAVLSGNAVDAGSKANQATAKVRLALVSDLAQPPAADSLLKSAPAAAAPSPAPTAAAPPSAEPKAKTESAEVHEVRRVALVIGNGGYQNFRGLPNAPNDARVIGSSLRQLGFEVTEGIDLDAASMQKATDDFLRSAVRAQIALLFYAGHGVQVAGRNYLVPVDLQLRNGVNPVTSMTDVDGILAGLDDQVRTNILILDACRNDPLPHQTASAAPDRGIEIAGGLAAPSTPASGTIRGAGTLIAFATAPGRVALDGEGSNSPFSSALSRHIGAKGLEVQQMLTRVRADVVAQTRGEQVPWSNSSLLGEVYLGGK